MAVAATAPFDSQASLRLERVFSAPPRLRVRIPSLRLCAFARISLLLQTLSPHPLARWRGRGNAGKHHGNTRPARRLRRRRRGTGVKHFANGRGGHAPVPARPWAGSAGTTGRARREHRHPARLIVPHHRRVRARRTGPPGETADIRSSRADAGCRTSAGRLTARVPRLAPVAPQRLARRQPPRGRREVDEACTPLAARFRWGEHIANMVRYVK